MSTKREQLTPEAMKVLRFHQDKLGADLRRVVEASFRLGYHMGRKEGFYMHRHNGQVPRGKSPK